MKGFVPTPPQLVQSMIHRLFATRPPAAEDRLLDPGCGTGAFIEGVIQWCNARSYPIPQIIGVESDPSLLSQARQKLERCPEVTLLGEDFLESRSEEYDYIIGNPPYVSITGLSEEERVAYRARFRTARGRFDLYLLFFEQALRQLKPSGRLVFITPEKFLYVKSAEPLRRELARFHVEEIDLIDESAFGDLVTYPTITTVTGSRQDRSTRVRRRDGHTQAVQLTGAGESWMPLFHDPEMPGNMATLTDVCSRISCGVATGADGVFVLKNAAVPDALRPFVYPTVSGRQLSGSDSRDCADSLLVPYDRTGKLLDEARLGGLGDYLREPARRDQLLGRTCVARKPWYAFHETPPLPEILQPKILCKDIAPRPAFQIERRGGVIPRHSVYYVIPRPGVNLSALAEYLNSAEASRWLLANCQRAANGFVRLQSHVLKRLPVPQQLVAAVSGDTAVRGVLAPL